MRGFPVCWVASQAALQPQALAVKVQRHAGYKAYLRRARQAGAVTGFVGGGSAATSPKARATLRTYEDIIRCDAIALGRIAGSGHCPAGVSKPGLARAVP